MKEIQELPNEIQQYIDLVESDTRQLEEVAKQLQALINQLNPKEKEYIEIQNSLKEKQENKKNNLSEQENLSKTYKKQIFKYKNGQNTHFFGETIGVQKMKARRHPTSVRRPPEERGGTGEKCVAVRLAERLAAVSGGTYLESRGLFPGRAAVKLLLKEISIRRKTAT